MLEIAAAFAAILTPLASIIASIVSIILMIQVLRQAKVNGAQGSLLVARQLATHKLVDGVAHDLARAKADQTIAEIAKAGAEGFTAGEAAQRDRENGNASPSADPQEVTVVNSDPLPVAVVVPPAPKPRRRKPKAPPA